MFEISQKVKLTSLNARAEIHGEDRRPAFDLKFEAACPSDVLIHFHPELRQMLYKQSDAPDLVEQSDPEALSALRFPKMGVIKWDAEFTGYTLSVDYGMGGESDIKMGDVKLDDFRFSPQNGGTTLINWRAICHPESEDVGKLCEFIQREVDIVVTAPEPITVHELFNDSEKPRKSKKEKQEENLAEAQKLFVAGGEQATDEPALSSTVLNPAAAWPLPRNKQPAA